MALQRWTFNSITEKTRTMLESIQINYVHLYFTFLFTPKPCSVKIKLKMIPYDAELKMRSTPHLQLNVTVPRWRRTQKTSASREDPQQRSKRLLGSWVFFKMLTTEKFSSTRVERKNNQYTLKILSNSQGFSFKNSQNFPVSTCK